MLVLRWLQGVGSQQARLVQVEQRGRLKGRLLQDSLLAMSSERAQQVPMQRAPVLWVLAQRVLGPLRGCCEAGQRR